MITDAPADRVPEGAPARLDVSPVRFDDVFVSRFAIVFDPCQDWLEVACLTQGNSSCRVAIAPGPYAWLPARRATDLEVTAKRGSGLGDTRSSGGVSDLCVHVRSGGSIVRAALTDTIIRWRVACAPTSSYAAVWRPRRLCWPRPVAGWLWSVTCLAFVQRILSIAVTALVVVAVREQLRRPAQPACRRGPQRNRDGRAAPRRVLLGPRPRPPLSRAVWHPQPPRLPARRLSLYT